MNDLTPGRPRKDLSDLVFTRLTVLELVGTDDSHNILWKCKCSCGNEVIVRSMYLRQGKTKSCGCLVGEPQRDALIQYYTENGYYDREAEIYKLWKEGKSTPELGRIYGMKHSVIYTILKRFIKKKEANSATTSQLPGPGDSPAGEHRRPAEGEDGPGILEGVQPENPNKGHG